MPLQRLLYIGLLLLVACSSPPPTCDQRLAAIDTSALTEREYDGPTGESAEGARIVHGYDADDVLRQVAATFYGEMGRREIVYAIADSATYTMTVTDVAYDRPISAGQPTNGGIATVNAFAVCDGDVVRQPEGDGVDDLAWFIDRLAEFSGAN